MIHNELTDQQTLARRRPLQPTKYDNLIINTLIKATNSGKAKNTITGISYSLDQLSKHADLTDPEQVKTYLANNTKLCNATDRSIVRLTRAFQTIRQKKPTTSKQFRLISTNRARSP